MLASFIITTASNRVKREQDSCHTVKQHLSKMYYLDRAAQILDVSTGTTQRLLSEQY